MHWDRVLRALVMLVFALLGWEVSQILIGVERLEEVTLESARIVVPVILGAALIGALLTPWLTTRPASALRASLRPVPTVQLIAATAGLAIGLTIAALLAYPLSLLPPPLGRILPFLGVILMSYLGVTAMVLRQREIFSIFEGVRPRPGARKVAEVPDTTRHPNTMLLDTSVIIDGRIADIAETGFLWAVLAVPRFVLNELQYIADSPEILRRNRGRRGLEMLDRLQQCEKIEIAFIDQDPDDAKQVDDKLISLGIELDAAIVTNDFNLNRVARLQGVRVLNINELANAVKSVVLPGEELSLHLIQEGKELNQGVGYLDDGTMVVVENGRQFLGNEVVVHVTKVLQTNAGRLIFAIPESELQASNPVVGR